MFADGDDRESKLRVHEIKRAQLLVRPVDAAKLAATIVAALKQPDRRDAYDTRIINAFLESFRETLEHYFGTPPQLGKCALKTPQSNPKVYLSAIIGFTGEKVKGSLALSFDRAILVKVGGHIFANNPVHLDDNMLADMAGEMSNQVCGGVKIKLAKIGLRVMIGLLKVVVGVGHRIMHIVKNPGLWVPVDFQGDKCGIEFCMDRNNEPLPEQPVAADDAAGGEVLLF